MSPALKHNPEGDELSQKVPLGENFAWWVFRRKNAAANDCCIREKQEVKLRLVSGERFPGQYYDQETNLYYNYFRDYDPATGRYVQSDPIGLAGGLNGYTYAVQNPVAAFDNFGLAAKSGPKPSKTKKYKHRDPGPKQEPDLFGPQKNRGMEDLFDKMEDLGRDPSDAHSIAYDASDCVIGWAMWYVWDCKEKYKNGCGLDENKRL